ncbi:hypothetical protein V8E36_005586 [Tilletia maclaganii]
MFQKMKERVTAAAADPRLDKAKAGLKKTETSLWRALEPVGRWSNKTAGKLGSESFWPTNLELECDKAARILRTFTVQGAQADSDPSAERTGGVLGGATKTPEQLERERKEHKYDARKTQKVIKKIPAEIIAQAKGLAIFTVFRTGLGVSGAGGSGVVVKRFPDGSWSGPSGILLHTIGWGFLIGLDIYDVVLVLRSDKAVEAFRNPKISVGAEIAVAAGPVGNGAMIDSGLEASPAFSYVKSKGFYAGLQLDGNIILNRGDENSRFYNVPGVKTADIFSGRHPAPRAAYPLLKTIYAAEGRNPPPSAHLGADVVIPEGPTPGDLALSAEDAAALEAEVKHQDTLHQQGTGAGAGAGGAGASGSVAPGANPAAGTGYAAAPAAGVILAGQPSYGPNVPPTNTDPERFTAPVAGAAVVGGAGAAAHASQPGGASSGKAPEEWEQPPPDYDFGTAPAALPSDPAALKQAQAYTPAAPTQPYAAPAHAPTDYTQAPPGPPPVAHPEHDIVQASSLTNAFAGATIASSSTGASAPLLSAEEEKEQLRRRYEAERAAAAVAEAGSGSRSSQVQPQAAAPNPYAPPSGPPPP